MKVSRYCSSRLLTFSELIAPFCLLLFPKCNQLLLCFLNGYVRKFEKKVIEECVVEDRVGTIACAKKFKPSLLTIDQESRRRPEDGRV